MDIDWLKFGELIKNKRKDKGLGETELAEKIGINQRVIHLAERGSAIGFSDYRLDMLKSILDISEDEIPIQSKTIISATRKKVFISYSHKDKEYLDRLFVHLKPLEKKKLIEHWADTRIAPGQQWKSEIEKALSESQFAILLISADFLASDFVIDNELPPLLDSAEKNGVTIIPVILKPCRFLREKTLSKFQSVNDPEEPVCGMQDHERELIYDVVAQRVESLLNN